MFSYFYYRERKRLGEKSSLKNPRVNRYATVTLELREEIQSSKGLLPAELCAEIEAMNGWVYSRVNNGIYETGFATSQKAYEENVYPLFTSLERLEEHLGQPRHHPYLFGEHITEADVRLYPATVRFDVADFTIFGCNLNMLRYQYPRLEGWLGSLYWNESDRTNRGRLRRRRILMRYVVGLL